MYALILNQPFSRCVEHKLLSPSLEEPGVNFSQVMPVFLIHELVSIHGGRVPSVEHSPAYLSDIRGARGEREGCERGAPWLVKKKRGRTERSPSLRWQDINQTNYGAAAVSNPWRENEMIRGRLQLNTERVNENINYLMIYCNSGHLSPEPPPTPSPLKPPTTHLF